MLAGFEVQRIEPHVVAHAGRQPLRLAPVRPVRPTRAAFMASGFSHITCLPACSARLATCRSAARWARPGGRPGPPCRPAPRRSSCTPAAGRGSGRPSCDSPVVAAEDAGDADAQPPQRLDVDRADEARPDDRRADLAEVLDDLVSRECSWWMMQLAHHTLARGDLSRGRVGNSDLPFSDFLENRKILVALCRAPLHAFIRGTMHRYRSVFATTGRQSETAVEGREVLPALFFGEPFSLASPGRQPGDGRRGRPTPSPGSRRARQFGVRRVRCGTCQSAAARSECRWRARPPPRGTQSPGVSLPTDN